MKSQLNALYSLEKETQCIIQSHQSLTNASNHISIEPNTAHPSCQIPRYAVKNMPTYQSPNPNQSKPTSFPQKERKFMDTHKPTTTDQTEKFRRTSRWENYDRERISGYHSPRLAMMNLKINDSILLPPKNLPADFN